VRVITRDEEMPMSAPKKPENPNPERTPTPRPDYSDFTEEQLVERARKLDIKIEDSTLREKLIEAIQKKEEPGRVDATRQAERADPESDTK